MHDCIDNNIMHAMYATCVTYETCYICCVGCIDYIAFLTYIHCIYYLYHYINILYSYVCNNRWEPERATYTNSSFICLKSDTALNDAYNNNLYRSCVYGYTTNRCDYLFTKHLRLALHLTRLCVSMVTKARRLSLSSANRLCYTWLHALTER